LLTTGFPEHVDNRDLGVDPLVSVALVLSTAFKKNCLAVAPVKLEGVDSENSSAKIQNHSLNLLAVHASVLFSNLGEELLV